MEYNLRNKRHDVYYKRKCDSTYRNKLRQNMLNQYNRCILTDSCGFHSSHIIPLSELKNMNINDTLFDHISNAIPISPSIHHNLFDKYKLSFDTNNYSFNDNNIIIKTVIDMDYCKKYEPSALKYQNKMVTLHKSTLYLLKIHFKIFKECLSIANYIKHNDKQIVEIAKKIIHQNNFIKNVNKIDNEIPLDIDGDVIMYEYEKI